ncbi:MAG: hypothetical protein JOZ17_16295, partial [Acetobacteraceae bacterium]|nr:hypothetical protein [Acetobacteraceae bacterium]
NADAGLRSIGVTGRTLLKIDIEGAEYLVVPAIAALLAETKPYLHLSFHPFNLVAGEDEYLNAVLRLRRGLQIAEALAPYRYMYFFDQGQWQCITGPDRMTLLRHYLLQPKLVPRKRCGDRPLALLLGMHAAQRFSVSDGIAAGVPLAEQGQW